MLQAGVKSGSCFIIFCPLSEVVPVAILLQGSYQDVLLWLCDQMLEAFTAINLLAEGGLVYPIIISIMQRISMFIAAG